MAPRITLITGPTASGKSGVALSLAQKQPSVIINADSQQVYADLRILTARPTEADEALVPHKLYGMLTSTEACSAGKWLRYAIMEIDWARTQGLHPIVVGGTGLYISALLHGIADIPDIDASVRQQAEHDYAAMGKEAFCERLRAVDPGFFERLKVYDRQRLVRAYSVWLGSGKSLSWWQAQPVQPTYPLNDIDIINITPERETLYAQCDQRFEQMVVGGAMDEVKNLSLQQLDSTLPIMKTIGLRELGAVLDGQMSMEEAATAAKQATRNYAKRQLTWFRNQLP
jgi:tRNA dimethylallyltransferase